MVTLIKYIFLLSLMLILKPLDANELPQNYRFRQMVPQPPSDWYFDQLSHICHTTDGTLWLVDIKGHIQHINADKSIIAEFPLDAEFGNVIDDIAAAPDGSIWIRVFNSHFVHYSANGKLLEKLRFGDALSDSENLVVTAQHMAVAQDGSLWITLSLQQGPTSPRRGAFHLSTQGKLLGEISCVVDAENSAKQCSTAGGGLNHPNGIALAADGSLWITDQENHRLQHYTIDGKLMTEIGQIGNTNEQFNYPDTILIAKNSSLWVMDIGNSRLLHLDNSGRFISSTQLGKPFFAYATLQFSLAELPDGSIWLNEYKNACCDTPYASLRQLSSVGKVLVNIGQGDLPGQFYAPQSIALAPDSSFWVADTENHRVQHFNAQGEFISQFTVPGEHKFNSSLPQAVALANDGSVWIADPKNHRVQHFQTDGKSLGDIVFDVQSYPQDLDFSSDGSAMILVREKVGVLNEIYNSRLYLLNASGVLSSAFKLTDNFSTIVGAPHTLQKIALAHDGSVWVTDLFNNILHFSNGGNEINRISNLNPSQSRGFALTDDGGLWVTDWLNNRVQLIGANGKIIAELGGLGGGVGQFNNPQELELAQDGTLWVVDTGNHRLQKYTPRTAIEAAAEFEETNHLLYLDAIEIDAKYYQATLQLQSHSFRLLSLQAAIAPNKSIAFYDAQTQILTIPQVQIAGKNYLGKLKYLGNNQLQLISVISKTSLKDRFIPGNNSPSSSSFPTPTR